MSDFENPRHSFAIDMPKSLLFFIAALILILPSVALAQKSPCQNASVQLQGEFDSVQGRGGIWTLMEQTDGLKEKSMIGIQIDGKLARTVVAFKTLCETGKNPTRQLFDAIQNILGDARILFNPSSSSDKLLESITGLNKQLDTLLSKIE